MRLIKTTNQRSTCFLTTGTTRPTREHPNPMPVAYTADSHPKGAHFVFAPVNRPVILLKKRSV